VREGTTHVISLPLATAEEMYVVARSDLFSEYRNHLTGVEYCISVLRSRRSPQPDPPRAGPAALGGRGRSK